MEFTSDLALSNAAIGAHNPLPQRMRALLITGPQRTGSALAETFVNACESDILLEEAVGSAEGMSRLHDEAFDVILASHEPDELDALPLVAGIRASGTEDPIVVLGRSDEPGAAADFYQVGAQAYLCAATATAHTLAWAIARAVEHCSLVRENRRLQEAERQRLALEHLEADRLLGQLRALLNPKLLTAAPRRAPPAALVDHYRDLLRAYVIMGSGNLGDEMRILAAALAEAGVSARQAIGLHVDVLQEMVRSLGNRSARHVIARADLLALEFIVNLSESYRQQVTPLDGLHVATTGRA